ncbi:hypothetical protein [Hyphomicrobium sp.]|uniref:hypothetical protein n=1 Tax=Hyphomicrobium sp. TaxID=82 RepID=UPI002D778940|nr:hypothetical protein [Hyphomicrobium sp.]HET6390973.1 hypothetical protein [Hyphomicrobium sp.]
MKDLAAALKRVLAAIWRGSVIALWAAREIVLTAWAMIRGPLIAALQVVTALIILFEEWGWRPLSDLIARLAKFAPIAAAERLIARLPPYAALAALALPTTLLVPLKFVAVWLLANGHFLSATLLFIGAKIASTAVIARLFILTKPSLMQIGWFASAYNWLMPWKDALFAQIRASWVWRYGRVVKARTKQAVAKLWAQTRPQIAAFWLRLTGRELRWGKALPKRAGSFEGESLRIMPAAARPRREDGSGS